MRAAWRILDPVFRIYRNGTLEHEAEAELSESAIRGGQRSELTLPALPRPDAGGGVCARGTELRSGFPAADGYGLGYDFPYLSWTIPEDGSKTGRREI